MAFLYLVYDCHLQADYSLIEYGTISHYLLLYVYANVGREELSLSIISLFLNTSSCNEVKQ